MKFFTPGVPTAASSTTSSSDAQNRYRMAADELISKSDPSGRAFEQARFQGTASSLSCVAIQRIAGF